MARKKKYSYGTGFEDMSMVLDDPKLLTEKGKKKRMSWKRRGLITD